MAGIWGDGQRGGIFGAKVNPRLQAELEKRAALKRQEMQPGLADQWHGSLANRILSAPSKLFGGLVVDPAMDLATLAGDVIHGRQPTMAADPQTAEFHTDPRLIDRTTNAAGMLTLGAGAIPAEANALRSGLTARLHHGSPRTDLTALQSSTRGPLGHGVYTTPDERLAGRYAGEEGKVYGLPERQRDIYQGMGHRTDEEWAGFKRDKERLIEAAEPDKRAELSAMLDKMWSSDGYPTFARISQMYGSDEAAQALFKRAGFEGISGQVDGPEVLLFGQQRLKPGIRAYHGSPHDFERFDASKIGTGEGAQAYGHGLYFAEQPATAEAYKKALKWKGTDWSSPSEMAAFYVEKYGGDRKKAIDYLKSVQPHIQRQPKNYSPTAMEENRASIALLEDETAPLPEPPNKGRMYEVDIAADPEHFLDWDKPLSEQSAGVQALFQTDDAGRAILPNGERVEPSKLRGESLYRAVAEGPAKGTGGASQSLREAGIPGIRYLDQGSRRPGKTSLTRQQIEDRLKPLREDLARAEATGVGQPDKMRSQIAMYEDELKRHTDVTHNFVVFDDKLISILKKYGLPISAAGLAALSQLHPEEAQAAQKKDRK